MRSALAVRCRRAMADTLADTSQRIRAGARNGTEQSQADRDIGACSAVGTWRRLSAVPEGHLCVAAALDHAGLCGALSPDVARRAAAHRLDHRGSPAAHRE